MKMKRENGCLTPPVRKKLGHSWEIPGIFLGSNPSFPRNSKAGEMSKIPGKSWDSFVLKILAEIPGKSQESWGSLDS